MQRIIGIKELYTGMRRISDAAQRGQSFLVVKNSKPVFRIEPIETSQIKKYRLADLANIRFRTKQKNLSKQVDEIVYED